MKLPVIARRQRFGVREIFNTLQGEGTRAGARSVFVRFSGCNLWDGNPLHREQGAGLCASWCDTDFQKGKVFDIPGLLEAMAVEWPANEAIPQPSGFPVRWVVFTGGEPGLQLTPELVEALHADGWRIAVETNGSLELPRGIDWVTVSPKRTKDDVPIPINTVTLGRTLGAWELKVVLPGAPVGAQGMGWTEAELTALEGLATMCAATALFVQPQDPILSTDLEHTALKAAYGGEEGEVVDLGQHLYAANLKRCYDHIMAHPRWQLSVQLHKMIGAR